MTPTPQSPNPKNIWKEQNMHPQAMTPQMLESRSRHFEDRIRARNRWEYLAGGIVAALTLAFGVWMLLAAPATIADQMTGIGFLVLGLGAIAAAVQLRRKAGGETIIDGSLDTSAAYRAGLVRQRDALRSVFNWYVAPFLPGFVLIYGANVFAPNGVAWAVMIPGLLTALLAAGIVWANRKAAKKLDEEIRALDQNG